jgi:hypothetical protein
MEWITDKELYEYIVEIHLDPCEEEYGEYTTETKSIRVKTLYDTVRKAYPELYPITLQEFITGLFLHCNLDLYHPIGYWGAHNLESLHIRGMTKAGYESLIYAFCFRIRRDCVFHTEAISIDDAYQLLITRNEENKIISKNEYRFLCRCVFDGYIADIKYNMIKYYPTMGG